MIHERVMTLREEPLVIATLHGPIEIHRTQGTGRDDRKLRLKLPGGLAVMVGMDRAIERNSWIEIHGGVIVPKHHAYQALPDKSGGVSLSGFEPAPAAPPRSVVRIVRRLETNGSH